LCCRSRSAPRSRPLADVPPVKIGCRRAALPAPRSRPVEALPARGAADVPRGRSTPGRLPHAPGQSLGERCGPAVLPVKIGPTLPARPVVSVVTWFPTVTLWPGPADGSDRSDFAGCPGARPSISNRGARRLRHNRGRTDFNRPVRRDEASTVRRVAAGGRVGFALGPPARFWYSWYRGGV